MDDGRSVAVAREAGKTLRVCVRSRPIDERKAGGITYAHACLLARQVRPMPVGAALAVAKPSIGARRSVSA